MSTLRDILDRFRPAPLPGRAGPVGVPSDARHTPADELAPVFAYLEGLEADCAGIRAEAGRRSADLARATTERISRLDGEAEVAAEIARVTAAAALRAVAESRQADETAAARRQAAEIYATGLTRLPSFVEAAVDRVRTLAARPP